MANGFLIPAESEAAGGPFASGPFRGQPCASAAGGASEAHSQGIANYVAGFAWAGRKRGIRLDLDATASQGGAGPQGGTGSVLRIGSDPDALRRLSLAATEPISKSSDMGGRFVALQQLPHQLRYRRATAAANQQEIGFMPQTSLGIAMKHSLAKVLCRCNAKRTAIEYHDQIKRLS